ncbi:MAG: hypothetical protein CML67_06200 [Rhodobacteraceae bacterium]|nr:hypothetical protein [Paracoccaceae bacterium]
MAGALPPDTTTSILSYVMGALQFCREELSELDEELSEDVDDIIHKIGSRILLNQEASRP